MWIKFVEDEKVAADDTKLTSVITGTAIPKDLAGIEGLEVGFQPPAANACRLLITGRPGGGKSTFLNSCKGMFMVDPEKGGKTVADPKALRFSAPDNADLHHLDELYVAMVRKIINRKLSGKTDITSIGFDSADEFVEILLNSLCLRAGVTDPMALRDGYTNGYTTARQTFGGLLDEISRAGMGWAVIAHTTVKTVRIGQEETQVSSLALSDTFKSMLHRKCEHYLFVESGIDMVTPEPVKRVVKGKEMVTTQAPVAVPCRYLKTQPGGIWKGPEATELKVRVPLPDQIRLPESGGYDVFTQAYDEAVSKLIGETK